MGSATEPLPPREHRKIRKPLMEKRRRARINTCLDELKDMLLEGKVIKAQGPKPMKLEKADILELTVQHVRDLQEECKSQENGFVKYEAGFRECLSEVTKCVGGMTDLEGGTRARLLSHLAACARKLRPFGDTNLGVVEKQLLQKETNKGKSFPFPVYHQSHLQERNRPTRNPKSEPVSPPLCSPADLWRPW
ncbi:unnamed protein product [Darwinula stevensoni]|uniref:Uncharacterized protein n=1 Tax=Darwinula stevensoni TaxID=69355 RepID=A0A7R8XD36_9CRUS|nr:unnamed protein product [Darwinula stevensoni]CAG0888374.1 unnamed protein product [Darwinula stevensoni]